MVPLSPPIEHRYPPITFNELRASLLTHEQRLAHVNGRIDLTFKDVNTVTAFHSSQSRGQSSNQKYFNNNSKGTPLGYNNQQLNNAQSGQRRPPKCQICSRIGHHADKCRFCYAISHNSNPDVVNSNHQLVQGFAGLHINSQPSVISRPEAPTSLSTQWIHGATSHMTFDSSILQQSNPYYRSDKVHVGDGKDLSISHIGSTNLSSSTSPLSLNNVLAVPHLTQNLLSVSKLTQDNDCSVEYFP
jgi:hypothetical protein